MSSIRWFISSIESREIYSSDIYRKYLFAQGWKDREIKKIYFLRKTQLRVRIVVLVSHPHARYLKTTSHPQQSNFFTSESKLAPRELFSWTLFYISTFVPSPLSSLSLPLWQTHTHTRTRTHAHSVILLWDIGKCTTTRGGPVILSPAS